MAKNSIFANIAKQVTTLSPLMNGREKMSMDDIIAEYPNGITVCEFDIINTSADSFPVFTFAEDDTKFAFGGTILHNILDAFVSKFEGDIESTSTALKAAGGLKMRFYKSRTKTGNNVTLVEVIDK